ncbi:MAG: hypothetical protein D3906_11275 [Candidatus Electrothrix sp. AUS1_2]|nr:hypothetical protein [Candidatus Electrothrix sp. AUS1_2]
MEDKDKKKGSVKDILVTCIIIFLLTVLVAFIMSIVFRDISGDNTDLKELIIGVIVIVCSVPVCFATLFFIWYIFNPKPKVTKKTSLSIVYFQYLKRKNLKIKIVLFLCTGIFLGLNWKFPQTNLSIILFLLLALPCLLIVKELLIAYRIKKGRFGTNRTEAKALIEFIIKNSDDIDFTDSNGNLRRALFPEAKPASTEQPLPAFGEEASA